MEREYFIRDVVFERILILATKRQNQLAAEINVHSNLMYEQYFTVRTCPAVMKECIHSAYELAIEASSVGPGLDVVTVALTSNS